MTQRFLLFLFASTVLAACNSSKEVVTMDVKPVNLTIDKEESAKAKNYRASRTLKNDLLHSSLDVRFDWDKSWCYGKATLTLKPYFYPVSTVELDAKGMDIKSVKLKAADGGMTDLKYAYDGMKLIVTLDKQYARTEKYTLAIDYIAKPDELEVEGSKAITDAKGLYFINPKGEIKGKPQQIWTQGETEASSVWFPTIDSPNERMTQELYITVDPKFKTLSNGTFEYSTLNEDGTRTDYWKQELPHAPYLVMMAIGDFAVIKDTWQDKEVNYYVEHKDSSIARLIFGNTPEMITFFSEKLGVEFPWDKYSQIVVRDYVSGAMENTSAVIFGDFMMVDSSAYLDKHFETVVAHELFHHWFGDLVTCESWSNLPMNESFANYSEFLWYEHKYGADVAAHHAQDELDGYLSESQMKQVDMIRFYYDDKEDMFDGHSYNKGGRILHMLRKYLGDEAFFEGLKLYLNHNKFKSVEIHNLRLAFEEVTGQDLNWFFNQWFLAKGHPEVEVSWSQVGNKVKLMVGQKQGSDIPVYRIPLQIDLYTASGKKTEMIEINAKNDTFEFESAAPVLLLNFDSEKALLCEKEVTQTAEQWAYQFRNAPLYLDRYEAIEYFSQGNMDSDLQIDILFEGLEDPYWNIRLFALETLRDLWEALPQEGEAPVEAKGKKESDKEDLLRKYEKNLKNQLEKLASKDEKSLVRAEALDFVIGNFMSSEYAALINASLEDPSYSVLSKALYGKALSAGQSGVVGPMGVLVKKYEDCPNWEVQGIIAQIYNGFKLEGAKEYFNKVLTNSNMNHKEAVIVQYGIYMASDFTSQFDESLKLLKYVHENDPYTNNREVIGYALKVGLTSLDELKGALKEIEDKEKVKLIETEILSRKTKMEGAIKEWGVESY